MTLESNMVNTMVTFLSLFLNSILLIVCVCACVVWKLISFFHHMYSWDPTQVLSLGDKYFHLMTHLAGLESFSPWHLLPGAQNRLGHSKHFSSPLPKSLLACQDSCLPIFWAPVTQWQPNGFPSYVFYGLLRQCRILTEPHGPQALWRSCHVVADMVGDCMT